MVPAVRISEIIRGLHLRSLEKLAEHLPSLEWSVRSCQRRELWPMTWHCFLAFGDKPPFTMPTNIVKSLEILGVRHAESVRQSRCGEVLPHAFSVPCIVWINPRAALAPLACPGLTCTAPSVRPKGLTPGSRGSACRDQFPAACGRGFPAGASRGRGGA